MDSNQENRTGLDQLLWQSDPATLPDWQRKLLVPARIAQSIGRDLIHGMLTLQAMSLVYSTLLSLVPLLAVSFSVLKGFGVHNQLQPVLTQALAPLGDKGEEIAVQLISYVDNTDVRVLGSVGLAVLLYSVISLISKIEQVFNYTWHVDQPRPLAQRFSKYLSALLVGPVLFFSAVGATASLRSNSLIQNAIAIEPLGFLASNLERLIPYLLITSAFAFAYIFVPNTRVRWRSALIGALVAGVLWQSIGYMFATFMAGSTQYAAIYSGLAIVILFMIWVYIAWLILLVGASIAFYDQYPEYLGSSTRDLRLSNRQREQLALLLATRVAATYYGKDPSCSGEGLSHALAMPLTNVRNVLRMLEQAGVLVQTADDPPCYVPARAPEEVLVHDLLDAIRRYGEDEVTARQPRSTPAIDALVLRLGEAQDSALANLSLRDLALSQAETGRPNTDLSKSEVQMHPTD